MSNYTVKAVFLYHVKELEERDGKAEHIYLTPQTIKELKEGKPVHCESCILIPPKKKK